MLSSGPAQALDGAHWEKADATIKRGIDYLRQAQGDDGSWSPQPGPAITGMVLAVMLDRPEISAKDDAARKAVSYILGKRKADGGIHDGFLQNYNTAICLSAVSRVRDDSRAAEAVAEARHFLRDVQWAGQIDPNGRKVDKSHAFYGGAGYGKHGRPDLSNTQVMLQGLYDSGLSSDDPAFERALVFISRCQGASLNDMHADKIVKDGGFIYATSVDKEHIGVPQSMAGSDAADEIAREGAVSSLRTYGSMTYAGFKSYAYAALDRQDIRVVDAYNWIRSHYSVDHNPGMPEDRGMQGFYYYLMTMSRALDAWGATYVESPDGVKHDWANDIIDKLVGLQGRDGSWLNPSSRWMEKDPNLVTAYALTALMHAIR